MAANSAATESSAAIASPAEAPVAEPSESPAVAAAESPSLTPHPRSRRLARPAEDCAPDGLLAGKKALVFGVANDHSIAWGIAKALHDQGARVGFSSMPQLIKRRVRPLAASIGSTFVEGADVRDDDEIRRVFERYAKREGQLDILVHAVAFAEKEDLAGKFSDTSRDGFHTAFDISVYSLIAMTREARPYMKPGSSIMTMTYYGAEKVVPHYNIMGVAKAALEATTRYLAADLGPSGIRVNAISAGPVRTLSAHGIAGFKTMYGAFSEVTPLRRHITIEDVGGTAVYLASPLSGQTTGEVIYVDGGFNILGLPVAEE
jgi:enoyl-[acyl-carrier protein] reductase I